MTFDITSDNPVRSASISRKTALLRKRHPLLFSSVSDQSDFRDKALKEVYFKNKQEDITGLNVLQRLFFHEEATFRWSLQLRKLFKIGFSPKEVFPDINLFESSSAFEKLADADYLKRTSSKNWFNMPNGYFLTDKSRRHPNISDFADETVKKLRTYLDKQAKKLK